MATQPGRLLWDWREVIPFYETDELVAFAAFGDIVVTDDIGQRRAPIRATVMAAETDTGWRIRLFPGSIPSDFS